jgi:hypothetical protein
MTSVNFMAGISGIASSILRLVRPKHFSEIINNGDELMNAIDRDIVTYSTEINSTNICRIK